MFANIFSIDNSLWLPLISSLNSVPVTGIQGHNLIFLYSFILENIMPTSDFFCIDAATFVFIQSSTNITFFDMEFFLNVLGHDKTAEFLSISWLAPAMPWHLTYQFPASAQMRGLMALYSDVMTLLFATGIFVSALMWFALTVHNPRYFVSNIISRAILAVLNFFAKYDTVSFFLGTRRGVAPWEIGYEQNKDKLVTVAPFTIKILNFLAVVSKKLEFEGNFYNRIILPIVIWCLSFTGASAGLKRIFLAQDYHTWNTPNQRRFFNERFADVKFSDEEILAGWNRYVDFVTGSYDAKCEMLAHLTTAKNLTDNTKIQNGYQFTREYQSLDYSCEQTLVNRLSPRVFYVHHMWLEIVWTILPCIILFIIAIPSFTLLFALDEEVSPWIWIKVIGNQWFWEYEYSSEKGNGVDVKYQSFLVAEDSLSNGYLRLLEVDNNMICPVNKPVRLLVTSNDVLHSWTVPTFGVKIDACPGRINSVTLFPKKKGMFYGQCSEICGINHAYMPIGVETHF